MSNTADYDLLNPQPSGPPSSFRQPAAPAPQQQQQPAGPSQADIDKLVAQHTQNTDQLIGTITALGEERNKLLNQPSARPKQPQFQDIPKAPQDNYRDVFKESSPGLLFATVMGSLFSRRHGIDAMNAAAGYIEGFHKGDKERMEQERQKWQDNVDAVIKQNQVESERYSAALNDAKLSQSDKQSKLLAIASSVGDATMINTLKNGDMDFAYKLQEDRAKAAQHLSEVQMRYGTAGGLSDQGLKIMVDQYLAGDKSVLQNIGRGAQGAQNLVRFRNALAEAMEARGISGADQAKAIQKFQAETAGLSAGERTGATQAANLQIIVRNAYAAIPQALEASAKVPRGRWVPINQLMQTADAKLSDPDLISFKQANLQLAELWARAMNPRGVMRESDRDLAMSMLSTATSPEAYKRVTDNLRTFLEREQKSVESFQKGESMEPQVPTDAGGWKIEQVQ